MNIYVGNLPYDLNEEEIKAMFAEFGQVSTVTLIMDRESGRPKGFGFVEMPEEAEGQAAVTALNGKEIKGRTVRVDKAEPRTERPRGGGGDRGGRGGRGGGGYGGGRGR
ncbi:MAG: RNA-binding protein [Sedimentisphaerales bacterium]|nr:RNA-binding protein [Sedimentisphaerales bacterium]